MKLALGIEVLDALPLLRELPDLEYVSLSNKLMDDKLMAELRGLPNLSYLNLYQSSIGDEGLKIIKTLPALRSVPMGETKVTDTACLRHGGKPVVAVWGVGINDGRQYTRYGGQSG